MEYESRGNQVGEDIAPHCRSCDQLPLLDFANFVFYNPNLSQEEYGYFFSHVIDEVGSDELFVLAETEQMRILDDPRPEDAHLIWYYAARNYAKGRASYFDLQTVYNTFSNAEYMTDEDLRFVCDVIHPFQKDTDHRNFAAD